MEAGFSFVEVVVTVAVLGTGFALAVGGMGVSILASSYHRTEASSQTTLRTYAEAIKAAAYVSCAAVASYPYPRSRVADGVASGNSLVSSTAGFTTTDVGTPIAGAGIPQGAVVTAVTNPSTATMSATVPTGNTSVPLTIGDGISRTVSDGFVSGTTLTSTTANFQGSDIGIPIAGPGIAPGTTIVSVTSLTQAVMSAPANPNGGPENVTLSWARVTKVEYWNASSLTFGSTCPSDAGLQRIGIRVQSRDKRGDESVEIVKRRP